MIKRKIKDKLVSALDNFRIVMLNGPRQSGKTTLVKSLAEELGMDYISLDDPEKLNLSKEDPKNFLAFYAKKPLVIDEVQFAPELIPYIKSYVDKKNIPGMFLLTGSADFMKMRKVTESLVGRMVRYNLYPLSTSELQIDNKTVLSYVELLEAMYIIKIVPSYHVNTSLKVIKSPKVHFLDTGLASYLLHVDKENLFKFKDAHYGKLIESFVYCELLKEVGFSMKLYYLFDFVDNWIFQINKTRHKDKIEQAGVVYPRVIEAKGKNPEQYPDWEYEEE